MLDKLKNELALCPSCKTALTLMSMRVIGDSISILRKCNVCKAHVTDTIAKDSVNNEDK